MKKIARFLVSVKGELKKIRWPEKHEMITYSIATLAFIITFGIFFGGLDYILAAIKTLVK